MPAVGNVACDENGFFDFRKINDGMNRQVVLIDKSKYKHPLAFRVLFNYFTIQHNFFELFNRFWVDPVFPGFNDCVVANRVFALSNLLFYLVKKVYWCLFEIKFPVVSKGLLYPSSSENDKVSAPGLTERSVIIPSPLNHLVRPYIPNLQIVSVNRGRC